LTGKISVKVRKIYRTGRVHTTYSSRKPSYTYTALLTGLELTFGMWIVLWKVPRAGHVDYCDRT